MPIAEHTIAGVLSNHMYTRPMSWNVHGARLDCECGDTIFAPIGTPPSDAVAHHLAYKLEEAGFSPIPEPAFEDEKEPDLGPCPHPGACPSVCWGCG